MQQRLIFQQNYIHTRQHLVSPQQQQLLIDTHNSILRAYIPVNICRITELRCFSVFQPYDHAQHHPL